MKPLILYYSKYGTTEACGRQLADKVRGSVEVLNIKEASIQKLKDYDSIIIGASIYAGTINKDVKRFIAEAADILQEKRIGIFLCCHDKQKGLGEFMTANLPDWFLEKAFVKAHLGHEIKLEAMNFFERGLIKHIIKVKESYSQVDSVAIENLAAEINGWEKVDG